MSNSSNNEYFYCINDTLRTEDENDLEHPIPVLPEVFPKLLTFRRSPLISQPPLLPTIYEEGQSVQSKLPNMLDDYLNTFCMCSLGVKRKKKRMPS